MKGMDVFCSSSASTAVSSTIDHCSMARRSTKRYASVRRKSQLRVPCSSQLPINPKTYYEKHRKSSSTEKQNSDVCRKGSVQVNNIYGNPNGSSTRYLLGDVPFIDWLSESDKVTAMALAKPADKPTQDQVVVLRVSLHCKACEGKVRKHISKMDGVTSFNIDMKAKKVTIVGHVTPLGVLASVSTVKNAQLWPSPTSSSSSSLSSLPLSTPTAQWST